MAVVGYVLVKLGTLKQEDSRVISLLLLFVIQPCMILRSLQIELTPDRMQGFLFATAASSISMLLRFLALTDGQKILAMFGLSILNHLKEIIPQHSQRS